MCSRPGGDMPLHPQAGAPAGHIPAKGPLSPSPPIRHRPCGLTICSPHVARDGIASPIARRPSASREYARNRCPARSRGAPTSLVGGYTRGITRKKPGP